MNEQTKKVEQIEKEQASPELVDLDLDQAAGGAVGDPVGSITVGLGKKPNPGGIIGTPNPRSGAA